MRTEGGPLKIGLKYCGGCRSYYDRVAVARYIQDRLNSAAVLVRPEDGPVEVAAVIHGCPSACADLCALGDAAVWMIGCPADAERFIEYVRDLTERNTMALSREEIQNALKEWNHAWARFDLEGVLAFMHDDVRFENWTGGQAVGKAALRQAWQSWFAQGGFRFVEEDAFIDEREQKILYRWQLEWQCLEPLYQGQIEKRRGVDVMHLKDGKIIQKLTYSKTTIEIGGRRQALHL